MNAQINVGEYDSTDTAEVPIVLEIVEPEPPAVPPGVRTVAYFVLLAASALTLLITGLAPIWFDEVTAGNLLASAGVIVSVLGVLAGGLGVAYRPAPPPEAEQE